LDYSIREAGRGVDVPIKYEAIAATEPYTQVGRSGHFIQFVVPTVATIFIALAVVRATAGDNIVFLWAVLLAIVGGSVFLVVKYRDLTAIRSTMFRLATNPAGLKAVQVLRDKAHDEIISELQRRWRDRLRRLHLAVNQLSDPKKETDKYTWLKEHGVISDEEYEAALAELRVAAPTGEPSSQSAAKLMN
jgi:hypothetical protein